MRGPDRHPAKAVGIHPPRGGQDPRLAEAPQFAVAHIFIPRREAYWSGSLKEQVCRRLAAHGFRLLAQRSGAVNREALGDAGRGG